MKHRVSTIETNISHAWKKNKEKTIKLTTASFSFNTKKDKKKLVER
jgi:hypothetical protein